MSTAAFLTGLHRATSTTLIRRVSGTPGVPSVMSSRIRSSARYTGPSVVSGVRRQALAASAWETISEPPSPLSARPAAPPRTRAPPAAPARPIVCLRVRRFSECSSAIADETLREGDRHPALICFFFLLFFLQPRFFLCFCLDSAARCLFLHRLLKTDG